MSTSPGNAALWGGRVLSGLLGALLVMSAAMKLSGSPDVVAAFAHLGIPAELIATIAAIELVSAALYLIPQTAVIGAILVTGYMGGAILAHVRLGEPVVTQVLIGVLAWGGLWLRDPRLRALMPLRGLK